MRRLLLLRTVRGERDLLPVQLEAEGFQVDLTHTREESELLWVDRDYEAALLHCENGIEAEEWLAWVRTLTRRKAILILKNPPISFVSLYEAGAEAIFTEPVFIFALRNLLDEVREEPQEYRNPFRSRRVSVRVPIEIFDSQGNRFRGSLGNISQSGMYFELSGSRPLLEADFRFKFLLPLKMNVPLEGKAQIRWAKKFRVGSQFSEVDAWTQEKIVEYLNGRLTLA